MFGSNGRDQQDGGAPALSNDEPSVSLDDIAAEPNKDSDTPEKAPLAPPPMASAAPLPKPEAMESPAPALKPKPSPVAPPKPPAPKPDPSPVSAAPSAAPKADNLLALKQKALEQLSPLVHKLDQSPEERFKTTMMMIQATDNHDLVSDAYDAAQAIADEKVRAQALLDVVNEINYFTQNASASK